MSRTTLNRTSEHEIAFAALRIAANAPSGEATTERLKKEIPNFINLTPEDKMPSATRPNELLWHQIVGNIISHRESEGNIIGDGYAEYTGSGIRITQAGISYLKRKGY